MHGNKLQPPVKVKKVKTKMTTSLQPGKLGSLVSEIPRLTQMTASSADTRSTKKPGHPRKVAWPDSISTSGAHDATSYGAV
ncbi:hypothetical protein BDW67DRAFT_154024, partial [Aspergillus spinulosporus]